MNRNGIEFSDAQLQEVGRLHGLYPDTRGALLPVELCLPPMHSSMGMEAASLKEPLTPVRCRCVRR